MNYYEFCRHNDRPTSLTKLEIENPFLVINELCKKRTIEVFHAALRALQSTLYRDDEWKNYNPADLYTTYEDITRVIDALFLINKHTPELSTILNNSAKIESTNEQIIAIAKLFKKDNLNDEHQDDQKITNQPTMLSTIYSDDDLHSLKIDLFNCLQIGLDVSYMENAKHEYFGGCDNNYALFFSNLEDLITEMYQIHLKEHWLPLSPGFCTEIKFATDNEHPNHLMKSEIEKPYHLFFDFYYYYIDHKHIYNGLNAWKHLLFEKDIWKKEQNPGNLVHLNQLLIELIEVAYLLIQNGQLKNINENYIAKKNFKKLVSACNDDEFTNPIIVIENFMAYKKSPEWKSSLYKWLKCSLDNDKNYPVDDKDQIDTEFNHLIKFTEAVHLLSLSRLPKNQMNKPPITTQHNKKTVSLRRPRKFCPFSGQKIPVLKRYCFFCYFFNPISLNLSSRYSPAVISS